MSKRKCGCIYADSKNTPSVRKGYEMGGYLKEACPKHSPIKPTKKKQCLKGSPQAMDKETLIEMEPLMKTPNALEFEQRLQWLSEGMLKNHLNGVINYEINEAEIALYKQYVGEDRVMAEKREIQRLEKLKQTKKELIELLGSDSPNYVQETILQNLDNEIAKKQAQLGV